MILVTGVSISRYEYPYVEVNNHYSLYRESSLQRHPNGSFARVSVTTSFERAITPGAMR